jgi:hypothetical protein
MATREARRFGAREVTHGAKKGSLHVALKRYLTLLGELSFLQEYLSDRALPREPEDRALANLTLILQNIVEYELERSIDSYVKANPDKKYAKFLKRIQTDYVTFKAKFDWARARNLLTDNEWRVLEEIRIIRNAQTHARPELKRRKYSYFGKPLLTRKSIQRLFSDFNSLVRKLRTQSGNRQRWDVIPPGYAEEMGWTPEP